MKIVVLNGSPKGDDLSVTMQYIRYIGKKFNQHELKIINISQRLNIIEKDRQAFNNIIDDIKSSNGVIWAFPLYVFTVHSNYQRFIELIFERNVEDAFKGKYAAIVATSIHFYDHTAINYLNSICDDLNMNYVDYFSAHMHDLKKENMRKSLLKFAQNYFDTVENNSITFKNFPPVVYFPIEYYYENLAREKNKIDSSNKKVVVITDSLENNNLKNMIERFRSSFYETPELINLQDIDIKGPCLGCLKCGYNYECAYSDKDGFTEFYNKLRTTDIIVFAGDIKYRYLSSLWKKFFDRGFFYTHTPSLSGKQFGFIISGPLKQIPNLKQVLEAYTQWQGSNIVGFVSDEYNAPDEVDEQLYALAYNLNKLSNMNYSKPATFLGVGGMKIFRDEIWGPLRFPFIADHKAYKKTKVYNFPHKNYKSRIQNSIFMLLSKIPVVRNQIYTKEMKPSIVKPLKEIVEDPKL